MGCTAFLWTSLLLALHKCYVLMYMCSQNFKNFHSLSFMCRLLNQRMYQVLSIMHCINNWYISINCFSSEQQPLKTLGETKFWNWNNLAIFRGKFTFDLMGRSFTVISTRLSSWIWNCLTFLWWKHGFQIVKFTFCTSTWQPAYYAK